MRETCPGNNFCMTRLAILSNFLVRSFFVFLIAYLWASYFFPGFWFTFLVAFLITCLVNWAWMLFTYRKKRNKDKRTASQEHQNKVMLQLKFMQQKDVIELFYNALKSKYPPEPEQDGSGKKSLAILNANDRIIFYDKYLDFSPLFHKEVTIEDVIECIHKTSKTHKTVVAAWEYPPHVKQFFESLDLDLVLMDGGQVYSEILEPAKVFPELVIQQKKSTRLTLRQLRDTVFARRKVKGYVFVGVIILITSIIIRPTLYYVLFSTLVFGMALGSFFRPTKKTSLFE